MAKAAEYKTKEYVSEHVCARWLGLDPAAVSRLVAAGEFGKTHRADGRLFISVRALQRRGKRVFLYDPRDPKDTK
jgi:hypothetical protein